MATRDNKILDGYVVVNSKRMEQLRLQKGMSRRSLAQHCGLSPTTVSRFFTQEQIQTESARKLFESLEIWDMRPYLLDEPGDVSDVGRLDAHVLAEWRIENSLTQPVTLSNGLEFHVFKLAHTVLSGTYGRGKCYDLTRLNTRDTDRVREQLLRHPTVCRAVGPHPQLPTNERVLYSEDQLRFWVIDRWFDGITLEEKLGYGPLKGQSLAKLMLQILAGLKALHDQQIVRRELSPKYIVLSEPDGNVLLTELELAKLMQGVISVSEAWDANPFLAPEIEQFEIQPSADLYSWGQVLINAATGHLPASPANATLLEELELPDFVKNITRRCLSLTHKFRPRDVAEVQQELEGWYRD